MISVSWVCWVCKRKGKCPGLVGSVEMMCWCLMMVAVAVPGWSSTHPVCVPCSQFSLLGCSSFPVTVLRLFCRASASDHGPPCPALASSTCPTVPLLYLRCSRIQPQPPPTEIRFLTRHSTYTPLKWTLSYNFKFDFKSNDKSFTPAHLI